MVVVVIVTVTVIQGMIVTVILIVVVIMLPAIMAVSTLMPPTVIMARPWFMGVCVISVCVHPFVAMGADMMVPPYFGCIALADNQP
ncbi:MAG: hypothetical protein RQM92_01005 [Candidatus Syntrophopropionicum ammoniitolerans]